MNTTQWQQEQTAFILAPELTISNAERAISLINRWLHGHVGQ
ncbi:MAG: hypothetical protein ACREA2_08190 [Blastocatellia bacterium]